MAISLLALGVLTGSVLAFQALLSGDPATPRTSPSAARMLDRGTQPSGSSSPSASPKPSPSTASATATQITGVRGVASGLCLDIAPTEPGAGGVLVMIPCAGTASQRWQFTATGMAMNGATGLCLSVAGGSVEDNARVQQETCADAANQHWRAVPAAGIAFLLQAVHSGKCLDVMNNGTAPGTPVIQFTCNGPPWQQWTLLS